MASSDYLVRTLNTLFNPFEYENILSPPQATPWSRALHHAGGLALGYGGLAVVLRKLMQAKQEASRKKDDDKLRSYAAARYPTLSPDPVVDPEAEKLLEAPGVEETIDIPELGKAAASKAWDIASPIGSLTKKTVWGSQDSAHLAMAAAAAVMGGAAGWKLADYIHDQNRGEELGDRVQVAADEIDRLLYEELQKKQPQQKVANRLSPGNIGKNPYRGAQSVDPSVNPNEPGLIGSLMSPTRAIKGLESLWWLWAVAAFALTYRAGKTYGDIKDPNRKRLKQLKAIAKERAKAKDAPVLMSVGDVMPQPKVRDLSSEQVQTAEPAAPKQIPMPSPVAPPKPKPQSLAKDMGKGPEVDKDDPYAHLLTT